MRIVIKAVIALLAAGSFFPMFNTGNAAEPLIEKKAADFSATSYLSYPTEQDFIKKIKDSGVLTGMGEAEYELDIPEDGWYELYAAAARWATDIYLDGQFLIYTPFESGVWEAKEQNCGKVMNLYLGKGKHTLKFSRIWFPGLNIGRFFLRPASDISGRCRISLEKDYLAFRMGEYFPITLTAGKLSEPSELNLTVTNAETKETLVNKKITVPAGDGNHQEKIQIPTAKEGVFDIRLEDKDKKPCDRIIQYCVIDTRKPAFPAKMEKELVGEIDPASREPDFAQGATRVVSSPIGTYRESDNKGRETGAPNASWFAYKLDLPSVQEPYLIEIEYPDDDRRTTTIVLTERYGGPQPTAGYFSGGVYPLSQKMLTQEFYFTPRDKDPRLMFYNWDSGRRAASGKIRIYRIKNGLPALKYGADGRLFGMYEEEPMRFLSHFGARADGDDWVNFHNTTERVGKLLNYAGINLWHPTIAVYQAMLWPGKSIPGYQIGLVPPGPSTLKEPLKKDVMRLMLLTCEKYGLNFVGDLHIPPNWILMKYLDKRFGGKGSYDDDGVDKPWLTVSKTGQIGGGMSPYKPYYNAFYPGVQEWTADVFKEIAERYKDSPAFKGLSIRFMGWAFGGWQTVPSINYGYEDYTIELFEKETGAKIPVDKNDPQRFQKRYDWLMSNAYKQWVDWRCRKVYDYHSRLAKILTQTNPDAKLYLFLCDASCDYDTTRADYEQKGWVGVLKESGINPALYADNPSIVLFGSRGYPDGGNRGDEKPLTVAETRDNSFSLETLNVSRRNLGDGTISGLHFTTNHEGPYAKYNLLGYEKEFTGQRHVVYPDSTINPAGIHYLERFANAMADGNITFLTDGSHGYVLGQPAYLRPFLAEYRSLPVIGMKQLGETDPAALWYGTDGKQNYFYLANRAYYETEVEVSFSGKPNVTRLTTGEIVKLQDNVLKIKLAPYQLIAFQNTLKSQPVDIKVKAPESETEIIKNQIRQAKKIIEGNASEITVLSVSISDLKKAQKKIVEAEQSLNQGKTWRARQALLHLHLIKIYEAMGAYPEGLFFKKIPDKPQGAMLPENLIENIKEGKAKLIDGEEITKDLAGEKLLLLESRQTSIGINIPYKGRYRISYSYPLCKEVVKPNLSIDGQAITECGKKKAILGERITSSCIALDAGQKHIVAASDRTSAIFDLLVEPIYRDIDAGCFRAIGPFQGAGKEGGGITTEDVMKKMEEPYLPEKEIDFKKTYIMDGKEISWVIPQAGEAHTDPFGDNYIDLCKTFGMMSRNISYALTFIKSPDDRDACLSLGLDYWAKIWINGVLVSNTLAQSAAPRKGALKIPIRLSKGTNKILIKIHAGSAGNGFWMAITDPGDLKISASES